MPENQLPPDEQPSHQLSRNGATAPDGFSAQNAAASSSTRTLLQMAHHSESRVYVSPLPPPADIERMEHLLPGAFERLLNMAEQDAKTTRENEAKVVDAIIADRKEERRESSRGQIFGLYVTLGGFALSAFITYLGYPVPAAVLGFAQLATLVSIFVVGKSRKSEPAKDDAADDA